MCVLPRGRQYISSPIWVGLMSELILHWFFQHLIQAGIFLSLHNAFQQGAEANFQVFPVFLLSDASRLQCCRVRALGPPPSAHGVGGTLALGAAETWAPPGEAKPMAERGICLINPLLPGGPQALKITLPTAA